MVVDAMKAADVVPTCQDKLCTYSVTNFSSSEETDGCGGGTTGFETSFVYSDNKTYSLRYCTSNDDDKTPENKGEKLATILSELGFFKTKDWISSIDVAKVECHVYGKNINTTCVISALN